MKISKEDWVFKVDGKTGDLEMLVPKRTEYTFEEQTVLAVSLMRFCQAIGAILDKFLEGKQKVITRVQP